MLREKQQKLISLMYECAIACNNCHTACLNENNPGMMAACIALDIDCAEMCSLVAGFLSRNSIHANHLLRECAEICNSCAEECEKHEDMDHCKRCAELCRKCAAACDERAAVKF